jgi:hypothetical protein
MILPGPQLTALSPHHTRPITDGGAAPVVSLPDPLPDTVCPIWHWAAPGPLRRFSVPLLLTPLEDLRHRGPFSRHAPRADGPGVAREGLGHSAGLKGGRRPGGLLAAHLGRGRQLRRQGGGGGGQLMPMLRILRIDLERGTHATGVDGGLRGPVDRVGVPARAGPGLRPGRPGRWVPGGV